MKKPWVVGTVAILLLTGVAFFLLNNLQKPSVPIDEKEPATQSLSDQTTNSQMIASFGEFDVDNELIQYYEGALGYYAKPKVEGSYPGVVMIHEWWGLNRNIKDMADRLASNGYLVLAVDLYNGKVAQTSDEARELTSSLDQEKALNNMKAAIEFLRKDGAVKLASLGWCFGGGQSLQLALSGQELDATVIYYGTLVTDTEKLSVIKWPVLGIFGETDTSIPVETVNEFYQSLQKLNIENEIKVYPGVGHAFANPSGQNYAPNETKEAWNKTLVFLNESLKK